MQEIRERVEYWVELGLFSCVRERERGREREMNYFNLKGSNFIEMVVTHGWFDFRELRAVCDLGRNLG